jgi:hypothetical protein
MARKISEFHYSTFFIEGSVFSDAERLHDELAFKLGLPSWYGRNFDALFDCLSSIGEPEGNLCSHWEWQTGKRLVLRIRGFSTESADAELVLRFAKTIADANGCLGEMRVTNRIWIEYTSTEDNGESEGVEPPLLT